MKYEKFYDDGIIKGECVKFYCSSYKDWKEKEAEIQKEFPNAKSVCMPGFGYAGEYWYKI